MRVKSETKRERVLKIAERQRKKRSWVCFSEIADWCARESGSVDPDGIKIITAYSELLASVFAGEFERNGRTFIVCVSPEATVFRVSRKFLYERSQTYDLRVLIDAYVEHCWIPCEFARKWFDGHRLVWPSKFEPINSSEVGPGSQIRAKPGPISSGRQEPWRLELIGAIERRLKSGTTPGRGESWSEFCDAIRDGLGAWINRKKRIPRRGYSDKTIQRIFRKELNPG
jgi:hypothetical protein